MFKSDRADGIPYFRTQPLYTCAVQRRRHWRLITYSQLIPPVIIDSLVIAEASMSMLYVYALIINGGGLRGLLMYALMMRSTWS